MSHSPPRTLAKLPVLFTGPRIKPFKSNLVACYKFPLFCPALLMDFYAVRISLDARSGRSFRLEAKSALKRRVS